METIWSVWVVISTIVTIATVISEVTPTKKDDEVMGKINSFIKIISLRFKELQK
tara:strand:- start:248 stop:409 length:162 start_codon:yes stop_codon:yes gene_type:complete